MNKIKYLLIAFFSLIVFNTLVRVLVSEKQKGDFVKITETHIDKKEIDFIKKRAHKIVTKIEKGEYYKFSKINTENDIIEKIDVTHQKNIQKQIKNKFGAYINLEFQSLFKSKTENPFTNKIYRFKGEFESEKDVEIRLYLSNKKEIIGLNVMSWKKEL